MSPDPAACTRPSSLGQLGVPGQNHTVSPGPWALTPSHSSLLPPPAQAGLSIPGKAGHFLSGPSTLSQGPPTPALAATALLGQPGAGSTFALGETPAARGKAVADFAK